MRIPPRTLYLIYGIGGYFYASLLTNYFMPTLVATLFVLSVGAGYFSMNDGRTPNP